MSEQLHTEQWLCFKVEDEIYAHQVQQVHEIISYKQPVPVPGSPNCVEGVLNIRGEVVTVISCRQLLGLDSAKQSEHIVVLDTVAGLLGVTVDTVDQIRLLQVEDMVPTPQNAEYSPIKATLNHQQGLLILTDFDRCVKQLEIYE